MGQAASPSESLWRSWRLLKKWSETLRVPCRAETATRLAWSALHKTAGSRPGVNAVTI